MKQVGHSNRQSSLMRGLGPLGFLVVVDDFFQVLFSDSLGFIYQHPLFLLHSITHHIRQDFTAAVGDISTTRVNRN